MISKIAFFILCLIVSNSFAAAPRCNQVFTDTIQWTMPAPTPFKHGEVVFPNDRAISRLYGIVDEVMPNGDVKVYISSLSPELRSVEISFPKVYPASQLARKVDHPAGPKVDDILPSSVLKKDKTIARVLGIFPDGRLMLDLYVENKTADGYDYKSRATFSPEGLGLPAAANKPTSKGFSFPNFFSRQN